jgi:hypothetical protein
MWMELHSQNRIGLTKWTRSEVGSYRQVVNDRPARHPEEIGILSVYLGSDESSFTTGQIHAIHGGCAI